MKKILTIFIALGVVLTALLQRSVLTGTIIIDFIIYALVIRLICAFIDDEKDVKFMKSVLAIFIIAGVGFTIFLKRAIFTGHMAIDFIIYALALVLLVKVHKNGKEEKEYQDSLAATEARNKQAKELYDEGAKYEKGDGVQKDEVKARELYQQAAALGNESAMSSLGVFYQYGKGGLEKDEKKAFELYKSGHYHLMLARCYRDGIGTEKDDAAAASQFESAMIDGYLDGAYQYAKCCENGIGRKQNYKLAFDAYKRAVSYGLGSARMDMARLYADGHGVEQDFDKAISLYTTVKIRMPKYASKCDKAIADVNARRVAKYFDDLASKAPNDADRDKLLDEAIEIYNESTCDRDKLKEFVEKIEFSARLGNYQARYIAGFVYENGIGVAKDEEIAYGWYKRAFVSGKVLDRLPGYELLCKKDPKMAEEMLNLGCENQCSGAFYYVAMAKLNGSDTTESNPEEGFIMLQKAASMGNVKAILKMADCCHNGIFMEKDEEEAAFWYQKALETETPEGKYAYSVWRLETREPNCSRETLIEILQPLYESAESNYPEACYLWGHILQDGGDPDSLDYFRIAAIHGHVDSMRVMLKFYVANNDNENILYWVEQIAETGDESAIRYAAKLNLENTDYVKCSYWWEKLLALGDPKAEEELKDYDELIDLKEYVEKTTKRLQEEIKRLDEEIRWQQYEQAKRDEEYARWDRQRKLDNARTIGLFSGIDDEADYLAKHFKNEINNDPFLRYLFPIRFPDSAWRLW